MINGKLFAIAKNINEIIRRMRSCLFSFGHRFVPILTDHFHPPGQFPLIYGNGLLSE
jgi:hypothetical protein